MMKSILPFAFVLLLFSNTEAQTTSATLSPLTKKYLREIKKMNGETRLLHDYIYKQRNGQDYISAIIKVNSLVDDGGMTALGVMTGTKAGNIWTVQIPLNSIEAFTNLTGIDYIQLDEPAFPTLNAARASTHADSVHAGIGLPMPYNGEGVVVGVVDAGFDFSHPAFFDTTGVNYRVKKVWMQKNNTGPAPNGFAYGTEAIDSLAIWGFDHDNDGTHATHVGGICAGSGVGSSLGNNLFRGFAYKSDLVFVGITPDKSQWINTGVSDMIDGINYIFTYADSVGKPAVANLSWGSPLGPRDGTGLFSQALDNLTGPGKIFACSAGNNGLDSIHIQKTFTPTDSVVSTFLRIADSPEGKKTWVDMWGDSSKTFCVEVSLYNNGVVSTTGFICLDDSIHDMILLGSNNDTCFVSVITSSAEFNNKPRVFLDFDSRVTMDNVLITVKSFDGTINFWNSFVSNTSGYYGAFLSFGYPWAVIGDNQISISDIASSKSAITVGAYVSKKQWTDISGNPWIYNSVVLNGLAPFSSKGPTTDGRIKPDITGPGMTLASAISSYDSSFIPAATNPYIVGLYHHPTNGRDYTYGMLSGTSMSSPAVSGITALLLQIKGDLTPQDVKDIYAQTAIIDAFTGAIPPGGNNTWGGGKVNAYGAVKKLLEFVGIRPIDHGSVECSLFPNPNKGTFTLNYAGKRNSKVLVTVTDMIGKCVQIENVEASAGLNSWQLNLQNLTPGIYFANVYSVDGYSNIRMTIVE